MTNDAASTKTVISERDQRRLIVTAHPEVTP
jgi:hypothetical protein